tara:strand:+ start:2716 stop:3258 length:543 start_codon:yes stop_codon:yes gene_type:complete
MKNVILLTLFLSISSITVLPQSNSKKTISSNNFSKDFKLSTTNKTQFIQNIIGKWEGKGTLMRNKAVFSMHWENTLNNTFLKLNFKNQFKDQNGILRELQSEAYYQFSTKTGYWFDSRGMILPLKLKFEDNSLTVFWGDIKTERGKTTYTLNLDQCDVEDFVMRNNQYFSFGKAIYKRTK